MNAKKLIESISGNVSRYVQSCQFVSPLSESGDFDSVATHTPPSLPDIKVLFDYLAANGISAVIVGSVAVVHYLKDARGFRPTHDLDLFVPVSGATISRLAPPPGWQRDTESPGVTSWISPSGGYVDFMALGHVFPDGSKLSAPVRADASSGAYPVARPADLFRLKLNSYRDRDTLDLVNLARATGIPAEAELGHLGDTAKENLQQIRQWLAIRP